MKIKIIEYEGSAEELAQVPELKQALLGQHSPPTKGKPSLQRTPVDVSEEASALLNELPADLAELLRGRSRTTSALEFLTSFLVGVQALPHVEFSTGESRRSADGRTWMIHVRRSDGTRGSFARVDARRAQVLFRLTEQVLSNCEHAYSRDVRPGDKYRIKISLDSDEALSEAVDLTKEAYEEAVR